MGRNLEPKCKQCRRIGEKLFFKGERCASAKCALVKRNYPPGFHGPKGRKKPTDYGTQLAEKQKARKMYGLMEKQFRITFEKAKNQVGNTGENMLKILEMRLDNAVHKVGLATSLAKSRQLVTHGHITVNGKKVDIPSFILKAGHVIGVKTSSKMSKNFKDLGAKIKKSDAPSWLDVNVADLSAKVLHQPKPDDIKTNINAHMIVEYYSR